MIGCFIVLGMLAFLYVVLFYFEFKERNRKCEKCVFFSKKTNYNKCKINGRFISKNNKCNQFIGD